MAVYTFLPLLFFVTEVALLIFKRSKSAAIKNERDRRSLIILWITIVFSMSVGPYITIYNIGVFLSYQTAITTGVTVFAIGFIIRWIAVYQLGKMFTVDVVINDQHKLKTSGLYQVVRHPSYLGLVLIIAGLAICFNGTLVFAIMVIPTFWAINHRMAVEEQALIEEFGDQYISYKSRVKRIIPFIY